MTQHFSGLTEGEQERFVILAEECAEVQQAICKALWHGLESNNNGKIPETNTPSYATGPELSKWMEQNGVRVDRARIPVWLAKEKAADDAKKKGKP